MLEKYSDPVFIICIEGDKVYDGAYCISSAFNDCFTEHGVRNDLAVTLPRQETTERSNRALVVASRAVRKYRKKGTGNVSPPVHLHEEFIESFGNNPDAASDAMVSTDWTIPPFKRVVWLGALGTVSAIYMQCVHL